jgi:dihydrofolate reductase
MSKVTLGVSMSLDGFIAGPNDSPELPLGEGGEILFKWYSMGSNQVDVVMGDREVQLSAESVELLEDASQSIGVLVYGRRTFDIARAWGGKHPMDVPMVIVTHQIPEEWANKEGSPFTFVTDGVASAIAQAKSIAGDKKVALGSATVVQQAIQLGLLDEIHIDLIPVLLGGGVNLFDHLGAGPIELENTSVSKGPGVIHLDYRVIK